jgi:formate-dependent nitrite reductase membrane component NrfD
MMRKMEGQKNWGWLIVLYVFLAGLGGGTFIFSFVLNVMDKYTEVARLGAVIGPLVVLVGTVMLLFDLGSAGRAYRLFTNPATLVSSWMIRGAWILTAFIIFGLAYALPAFAAFAWLPWNQTSGFGLTLGIIGVILGIIVPIYPGLLFGVIKSIPFWNTSALPPLFFLSGLDTGIAALGLLSLSFPGIGIDGLHQLGITGIILIILVLISLATYIEVVRQVGNAAAESVRLLKSATFILGVVVLGLVVPLILLFFSIGTAEVQTARILEGIAAVLVLLGGLLLRYTVVTSGVRVTIRSS